MFSHMFHFGSITLGLLRRPGSCRPLDCLPAGLLALREARAQRQTAAKTAPAPAYTVQTHTRSGPSSAALEICLPGKSRGEDCRHAHRPHTWLGTVCRHSVSLPRFSVMWTPGFCKVCKRRLLRVNGRADCTPSVWFPAWCSGQRMRSYSALTREGPVVVLYPSLTSLRWQLTHSRAWKNNTILATAVHKLHLTGRDGMSDNQK